MPFIEAPTTFYMGRRYDPHTERLIDDVVYYDSRDLTTHAVVVGMTGSGKTGLCINLLEEAVLDNIPSIIIDPKGDITNLLLTFPDMRPGDFMPWVNVDEARRAGMEMDEYAADVADRWREGLQAWGIVPDRVRWMKQVADYNIYTPGSDAGLPISILDAMHAPREGWVGHEEAHSERISGVVSALLGLIGMEVDIVDREHVLIANIFVNAWQQGQNLTLEDIIVQVQQPPFAKLGVFDIDTYFPEKDRFKLAMALNNIIAAPSFQSWLHGEPLDVRNLLYQADGRPRVSVFYIAHLNEAEQQFIITLILENLLAWMRTLSGTTSLRAMLYIDEMFGLFPPYPKNPPTKNPIMQLLKQARAFGLGLVLSTQNPGDLDYKGLSNAGTWFIGKLQTENDKKRVLTGLEALANAQSGLNMRDVDDLISQLDPRVFLMHNVHDQGGPTLLHTRWSMSYLRGPLTRTQVSQLMASKRAQVPQTPQFIQPAPQPAPGPGATPLPTTMPEYAPRGSTPPPPVLPEFRPAQAMPAPPTSLPGQMPGQSAALSGGGGTTPIVGGGQSLVSRGPTSIQPADTPSGLSRMAPVLPSDIAQYFLHDSIPLRTAIAQWEQQTGFQAQNYGGAEMVYKPVLLAQASVRFMDRKTEINTVRQYAYHVSPVPNAGLIHWEDYLARPIDRRLVENAPLREALYADLSPGMSDKARLKALQKEVVDQIYHSAFIPVPYSPALKVYGDPDGGRRDFRVKLQAMVKERRDEEIDKLVTKYETVLDRLDDKLRKEGRELDADRQELSDRKREQMFTGGEALMSLFRGRTTYTLSRYSRTQRYTRQARAEISESKDLIDELEEEMERKQIEMERDMQAINDKWTQALSKVEEHKVTPLKKNIHIELFGIGWLPFWFAMLNNQPALLPGHPIVAGG